MSDAQSFKNHARLVPPYHYFVLPMMLVYLVRSVYQTITAFSMDQLLFTLFVLAVAMTALFARVFALKAQDRVIRLEERMRLQQLLGPDLMADVPSLTTEQLIGIRFASDGEVEYLVRRVSQEGIEDRKTIKGMVQNWRADNQRV